MPPEPNAASDRARRRSGATWRPRRRGRLAGPRAGTLLALFVALVVGPALAGPGAHPDDGDGCPPPSCACIIHLGAVQIAPPETPTTAATPAVAGRIAAELRSAHADRPCADAHRPRGPPGRDDA
jgi:hypothetical protein